MVEEVNKVVANLQWNKVETMCTRDLVDLSKKTTDFFNSEQKLMFDKILGIRVHQRKLQMKISLLE